MRVLKTEETKNVTGGTFGLLSWVFGGWGRSYSYNYGYNYGRSYSYNYGYSRGGRGGWWC